MKPISKIIIGALIVLGIGATGYWFGTRTATQAPAAPVPISTAKAERKILYYRNPMGLKDTSPVPKKDPMGMDYVPVYEGGEEPGSS
ncbi:MAG: efflux RND transporter periplasmic adaptor subunit, partial [Betaproteobacteria bacterium]|nr:efflux RND transporter periplasmic adaptor subunit [Betaproteobacteria bacterium]